jgi:hypothetical protein
MRKLAPWLLVLLVGTFHTAAFAGSGQFRGHLSKIEHSDDGLTAPSSAAADEIVRAYVPGGRSLTVKKESRGVKGAKHLVLEQSVDGRPVYGAYVKATAARG